MVFGSLRDSVSLKTMLPLVDFWMNLFQSVVVIYKRLPSPAYIFGCTTIRITIFGCTTTRITASCPYRWICTKMKPENVYGQVGFFFEVLVIQFLSKRCLMVLVVLRGSARLE